MAAPKNNSFWKMRSKHGRDKIFKTPEIMLERYPELKLLIGNERYGYYINSKKWQSKAIDLEAS